LKVATTYQKKGTKRRIIFLLILLVVGMFILLLVKPKRHKEPALPAPVDGNVPPP
jgi:syntaxin 16